jgi:hypothetical protein
MSSGFRRFGNGAETDWDRLCGMLSRAAAEDIVSSGLAEPTGSDCAFRGFNLSASAGLLSLTPAG